jgi:MFS family permease
VFRGWFIVAIAFLANFVATGVVIHSFPIFLLPLSEEFGLGRAVAALPPTVMMICGIAISPLVGRAVTRYPIRNIMLVGALALAAGFLLLSRATSFWQILLIYGPIGSFSLGALGVVCTNSLVVNWFDRRRAMALGIAMIGMSISGAIVVPLASWAMEAWGWRTVYASLAGLALCVAPIVAWGVVSRPEEVGLHPDGLRPVETVGEADPIESSEGLSTRDLLTSPLLWGLAAACGLSFFGSTGFMSHAIAFAGDQGIEPLRASALLSAIATGAAVGKLIFGWLADRLGEHAAFGVALFMQLCAFAGLWSLSSYWGLVLASALYGVGIGGISPLQASLLARIVGARDFGPAMGLIGPMMIPFQITGAPVAGWIFDAHGGYDIAFALFVVALLLSGGVMFLLHLKDVRGSEVVFEGGSRGVV